MFGIWRSIYFVQPGDTLEIFTTLEHDFDGNFLHTAFRSNSETAMINALLPKMFEKLGVLNQGREVYETFKKATDGGKESSERLAEEWGAIVEKFLTRDNPERLPDISAQCRAVARDDRKILRLLLFD